MDDPHQTTQFAAEETTWELRVSKPSWDGATPSIEYELVKLDGDASLIDFAVRLRDSDTGAGYDGDRYIPLSSGVPARGVLYAPADATVLSVVVVGFQEGEEIQIMEISGVEVPDRPDTEYEYTESPIPMPTWAAPMGDTTVIAAGGEVPEWTEATIESVSTDAPEPDRMEYEIEVGSIAIGGETTEITRTLTVTAGNESKALYWYGENEHTVTIPRGETKTVSGSFKKDNFDRVYVRVDDTARELPSLDWDADDDPFAIEPRETIQIPKPDVDVEKLEDDPALTREAVDAPVDGYNYYSSDSNMVNDERFVTALLDYRAGKIGDLQMTRLHALYLKGPATDFSPVDKEVEPEGSPVLVGMDDSGTVRIRNDREKTPDLFGYGPLFRYDDSDFTFPRGATTGQGYDRQAVTGLVPGFEYQFGFDKDALDNYTPRFPYFRTGVVSDPVNFPEPEPASVEVACSTDTDTITAGEQVTVVGDVTAGDGDTDADVTVRFEVAGESATESVTVAPNSSATVEATFEITEPGEYVPEVTIE